jgi:hypothetical protein
MRSDLDRSAPPVIQNARGGGSVRLHEPRRGTPATSERIAPMITVVGGMVLVVLVLVAAYRLGYLGGKDRFR